MSGPDRVDDMLRTAGELWRAAQPPPPELDTNRWAGSEPARRRWMPVAAAAGAVAIVAGSVLVLRQSADDVPADLPVAYASASPADLVVREGDTIRGAGLVWARPGQDTLFCAPAISGGVGIIGEQDEPSCDYHVPVDGVDLVKLSFRKDAEAGVTGYAELRGVWRAGRLNVTGQQAVASADDPDDEQAPCAPPANGWKAGGEADSKELHEYVTERHPDQFGQPWLARPAGSEPGTPPTIMVVPVVRGDLPAARRDLGRRYTGNLCLVHAPDLPSLADQARAVADAEPLVTQLMRDESTGVYGFGQSPDGGASAEMVMLTPALEKRLDGAGGADLDLRPWLRPLR